MADVTVTSLSNLQNEVRYGAGDVLIADEPVGAGGDGAGPDPYALLLAALGSCISMTTMLYARQKNWPVKRVHVRLRQQRIHAADCSDCEHSSEGFVTRIERAVRVEGDLEPVQLARLQEIARKCPVHKTLTSEIVVVEMEE
jgi:uncharacterized OsmC-like protein